MSELSETLRVGDFAWVGGTLHRLTGRNPLDGTWDTTKYNVNRVCASQIRLFAGAVAVIHDDSFTLFDSSVAESDMGDIIRNGYVPAQGKEYAVHIYPICRIGVQVIAPTPVDAAEAAYLETDLYTAVRCDAEYAEDIHSYFVDVMRGDGTVINSIELDGVELDGDGKIPVKPDPILERSKAFMAIPPAQWQEYIDKLKVSERREMDESLADLLIWAARAYGYSNQRFGEGCGDQGHDSAVKESNKMAAVVRKGMGYSQPKHDIRF